MSNIYEIKKEDFIYENKSLTDELCDDVVDLYEKTSFESIYTESLNISIDSNYAKILNTLLRELNTEFRNYQTQFKNHFLINSNKNNNNNYTLINIKTPLTPTFFLKKTTYNNETDIKIEKKIQTMQSKIKVFIFIWLLNDYDGELTFWNNYKINFKKGSIIIFPVSWCFPYKEIVKLNSNKYIIFGYINF